MAKTHYHMRPAGLFLWAIDGYDARGGWQVTISPDGVSRSEAKAELRKIRVRARKSKKNTDALSAERQ